MDPGLTLLHWRLPERHGTSIGGWRVRAGLAFRYGAPACLEMASALPNVLTEIRLRHYSGAMTPDLHLLAEKIEQLAALAQHLRRENADLRLQLAAVNSEKTELDSRLQEACRRTAALLDKLPQHIGNEEAA